MTKTSIQSLESCNQKNILCRLLSKTNNTFMKYSGNKSSSQYLYPAKFAKFKSILVQNENVFFPAWKQIVQNKKIHKSKQLHRKNNIASSSKASHTVMTNLNCIHIILLGLKLLPLYIVHLGTLLLSASKQRKNILVRGKKWNHKMNTTIFNLIRFIFYSALVFIKVNIQGTARKLFVFHPPEIIEM